MTRLPFDRVLSIRSSPVSAWLVAATLAHAGLVVVLARNAQAAPPLPSPPVEVELETPPPPPPVPPPTEPKLEEKSDVPSEPAKSAPAPQAPAPAKAGAILAAKDDAPAPKGEEPVSFVTDPNGESYGSGVVAKGGTAKVGLTGAAMPSSTGTATKPVAPPPPPPKVEPVPTTNLSKKPSLDQPDACKGYFPQAADDDAAVVTLRVIVRPDGSVQAANVVSESPKGQGFGVAARTCLLGRTFTPGLSEAGQPTLAQTTVNVRFSR